MTFLVIWNSPTFISVLITILIWLHWSRVMQPRCCGWWLSSLVCFTSAVRSGVFLFVQVSFNLAALLPKNSFLKHCLTVHVWWFTKPVIWCSVIAFISYYYLCRRGVVMWSFCLSFILLFCKLDNWWMWKRMSTILGRHGQGVVIRIRIGFRITSSFSSPLWNSRFLGMCLHLSCNPQPICIILGKITDADNIMHLLHFGTDPTDIRINLIIQIRIPDHFQLTFWHRQRFAVSECSCY